MSHEQKMVRLSMDNIHDVEMSNALKQTRRPNRIKCAIRRNALENATAKLDQNIGAIKRLHDGENMFKSVDVYIALHFRQPTIDNEYGRTIQDPGEYADDVDSISNSSMFLGEVQRRAPGCLLKWHPISMHVKQSTPKFTEKAPVMLRNGEKHANSAHCWGLSKTWHRESNLQQWLSNY